MATCPEDQKVSLEGRGVLEERIGWTTSQYIDLDAPAPRTQSFREHGQIGAKRRRDLFLEACGRHVVEPEPWFCRRKLRRQCGNNPDRRFIRPRYRSDRLGGQDRAR
jgi:hypothetical protein